jgi:hypothetical protein
MSRRYLTTKEQADIIQRAQRRCEYSLRQGLEETVAWMKEFLHKYKSDIYSTQKYL